MHKALVQKGGYRQLAVSLSIVAAISVGLFTYNAWRMQSLAYSYLLWNLFLALLPLLFALRIVHVLSYKLWSAWESIAWTLLWLLFVPNSFYLISDYIHLRGVNGADILYTAVMFTSFIFFGVALGFASLYLVHSELRRRVKPITADVIVGIILLVCSFGIYIGRDLRWNSWDVVTNPGGLLFDLSDRVLRPEAYPTMLLTTASFTLLLGGLYVLGWQLGATIRSIGHSARGGNWYNGRQ